MPFPNSKTEYSYKYKGWKFPTLLFALTTHEAIAETYEMDSIRLNENLLLSALNAPIESAGGQDAYPTFFEKVAALGYRIIANHPFQDGNKRLGLLLIIQTLRWNDCYPRWGEETKICVISLVGAGYLKQDGLRHALLLACRLDPSIPTH